MKGRKLERVLVVKGWRREEMGKCTVSEKVKYPKTVVLNTRPFCLLNFPKDIWQLGGGHFWLSHHSGESGLEARNAAKYPAVHRTAHSKESSSTNMNCAKAGEARPRSQTLGRVYSQNPNCYPYPFILGF